MSRKLLMIFISVLFLISIMTSGFIGAYAAEFVTENGTITVYDAPDNGTLIVAAYGENNALLGCKMYNSQSETGTITANYAEDLGKYINNPGVSVKQFLWNMNTLKPFTLTPARETSDEKKVLVAYFSCTNNTEGIAKHILNAVDADEYEIVPEIPYTTADLNYSNSSCRANLEQNDASARPAISGGVSNMEDYDIIFLGYPIWWGQAPKIIYTFLESYDFGGKTIVPFCTSASSGVGSSAANLHSLCSDTVTWTDGRRFASGASSSTVVSWIDGLDLDLTKK